MQAPLMALLAAIAVIIFLLFGLKFIEKKERDYLCHPEGNQFIIGERVEVAAAWGYKINMYPVDYACPVDNRHPKDSEVIQGYPTHYR